jgi:hypothetical protein
MPLDDVPAEETVYDSPPVEGAIPPLIPDEDDDETVIFPDEIPATFGPYDPSAIPASFGAAKDPAPQGTQDVEPSPVEFDPRWKEEFEGLLYVGALTSTFNYLGHRFVIRTLTQDELLEVSLAIKEYADSDAAIKAQMMAIVAASVLSVDGKPMPSPVTLEPGDTPFANRWRYVRATWYPPVIDFVFSQYVRLEYQVREVIDAMGNLSG